MNGNWCLIADFNGLNRGILEILKGIFDGKLFWYHNVSYLSKVKMDVIVSIRVKIALFWKVN